MMANPDDKQQARAPMREQLNLIMAMQVHGLDGNGPFLREILKRRDTDRLTKYNGEVVINPKESVLVLYKYAEGGNMDMYTIMFCKLFLTEPQKSNCRASGSRVSWCSSQSLQFK